jgi:polyphosphate kinase 2 (PPK2 family)
VTIVKCFLHVSKAVQSERLLARLEVPTKYWKYNPGDIDERGYWDAYQQAYSAALSECNTDVAPWYVIPSDRKWYRNWAIAALLTEALETIDPAYPPASFDIETEKRRVLGS